MIKDRISFIKVRINLGKQAFSVTLAVGVIRKLPRCCLLNRIKLKRNSHISTKGIPYFVVFSQSPFTGRKIKKLSLMREQGIGITRDSMAQVYHKHYLFEDSSFTLKMYANLLYIRSMILIFKGLYPKRSKNDTPKRCYPVTEKQAPSSHPSLRTANTVDLLPSTHLTSYLL